MTENAFPLFFRIVDFLSYFRGIIIFSSLILVVFQAFFLTNIINRHNALKETSHLPALLYVVMMSCFPEQLTLNPLIFANCFILLFLNSVFHLYRADNAVFYVFDAGLFIGIASLFYWPAIFLFPLIWAGLTILRPFNWKEWTASILGLALPVFCTIVVLISQNMMSLKHIREILKPIYNVELSAIYNRNYIILFVFLIMLVFASLLKFSRDLNKYSKLRTKKFLTLLVWFFIFAGLSYLVSSKKSMVSLSFLAIPLAVLISNYFLSLKNRFIAEGIFLLLIAAVIYNQVLYFLNFFPV